MYSKLERAYIALDRLSRGRLSKRQRLERDRLARIQEAFAATSEAALKMVLAGAANRDRLARIKEAFAATSEALLQMFLAAGEVEGDRLARIREAFAATSEASLETLLTSAQVEGDRLARISAQVERDRLARIREAFAATSEATLKMVLAGAAKGDRLARIKEAFAATSEAALEMFLAAGEVEGDRLARIKQEFAARSEAALETLLTSAQVEGDRLARIQEAFAATSEATLKMVLAGAAKGDRLARIQEAFAATSEAALQMFLAAGEDEGDRLARIKQAFAATSEASLETLVTSAQVEGDRLARISAQVERDRLARIKEAFAATSEVALKMVLAGAAKGDRLARIQEAFAATSEASLQMFLAAGEVEGDRLARIKEAFAATSEASLETLLTSAPVEGDRLARIKEATAAASAASLQTFLASGAVLHLGTSVRPVVSVLIVTFNRADLSFACLRSLVNACEEPFEVILVDNNSTDLTRSLLERVRGARIIHNDDNLHFVRGANQAAAQACGEFLLFLNNDAQALPAAVTSALRTLRSSSDVGAVGGKIVLLDGTLQEAGSIVWSDGSCLGYGRGRDPLDPEYMFLRDVDYCSGAFFLTRRATFEAVGGFDVDYAPAYYEEADYCLKLWERGLRVVYDPRAVVLHFEFGSAPSEGAAMALQESHRHVLKRKRRLEARHPPDSSRALFARDRRSKGLRILYLDDQVPDPSLGAGLPRANQLLRCLVERGHFVTFYPLFFPSGDWPEIYRVVPHEVEVMRGLGPEGLAAFLRSRTGYYDVVLVSRPHNMRLLEDALSKEPAFVEGLRVVYDAEALFCLREVAARELRGETVPPTEIEELLAAEVALTRRAHAVISVSAGEAAAFAARGVPEVHVLSQSLTPTPTPRRLPTRRGFLFVGAVQEGSPNADSLVWFIEEVWPLVRPRLGAVDFVVVGVNTSPRVLQLSGEGVQFLGRREDLAPLYDGARVFVAPTRFGAGIPLKIQEAAAHGVPVVTTGVMGRQLGWQHGVHILMADSPQAFAAACIETYRDPDLWKRLRRNALERVAEDCSPARFALELDLALGEPERAVLEGADQAPNRSIRSRTAGPRNPRARAG